MADAQQLYSSFNRNYEQGLSAKQAGDVLGARRFLLRAADDLNKLANESFGTVRTQRKAQVKRILDAVERLGEEMPVSAKGGEAGQITTSKPKGGIRFDDIIGLDEAKKAIFRMVVNPLKSPEVYRKYKLEPGGNVLLEGAPGTGKTSFAKAVAGEIGVPFIAVDTNSLVDSYIGKTGKNIDKMFASTRALIKKSGTPVVLFLDEFDSIAGKRGGDSKTADEAVPTLIRQMDGFDTDNGGLVILASTNLKENLDSAVLSRFRNKIHIPLPSESERALLLRLKLGKIAKEDFDSLDFSEAARLSEGFSGRDLSWVCEEIKNVLAERDAGLGDGVVDLNAELLSQIAVKKRETGK